VPQKRRMGCLSPVGIGVIVILLVLLFIGLAVGPIGKSLFGNIIPQSIADKLAVSQPEPELPDETVFHIGGFPITNTIIAAWVTILFLVLLSWAVTRRMKLVPGRLQAAFEFLLGWVYDLCRSVAGEENGRKFFPIVCTIFLFVGFNAWLSLIPGYGSITVNTPEGPVHLLRGANTDINMPLAFGLMAFLFIEGYGFKTLGGHYAKKFFNFHELGVGFKKLFKGKVVEGFLSIFTGAINVFTGMLELLSEFIRIVSFTFRLFGNMTAGEILLLVVMFLVPWLAAIPFYGLELLIGFLQALIFGGLTLIFLSLSVAPHEEAEEE
jgi:F-type H+-transporting ATPase subunit a